MMATPTPAPHDPDERDAILNALDAFIRQRPGLEPGNYITHGGDMEGRRAYRAESRAITRDLAHARALLRAVRWRRASFTADDLKQAMGAYSGRLSVTTTRLPNGRWRAEVDYCTGQYFPTEYRRAVCAVLTRALWDYWRADMTGENVGERIRKQARALFGRAIADRWFN